MRRHALCLHAHAVHDTVLAQQVGNGRPRETAATVARKVAAKHQLRVVMDDAHRIRTRSLAVKANPPTYQAAVADIAQLLRAAWGDRATPLVEQTIAALAAIAEQGGRKRDRERAAARELGALKAVLAKEGRKGLSQAESDRLASVMAAAYSLGQREVTRPLGWQVSFDLPDQDTLHALHGSGLYWIGEHYGDHLDTKRLLAEVQASVTAGEGRKAAGERLRQAFQGQINRSDVYWEGLAATISTRARSFGALSGMQAVGVVTYEYVNPMDERTSAVCEALDGTVFTVKASAELRDRLIAEADTPEKWVELAAWPKVADLYDAQGERLSAAELQAKGIAWPPLHFHCRSSIDAVDFGELTAVDLHPIGNPDPEPRAVKPPPKPATTPAPETAWSRARAEWSASEDALRDAKLSLDGWGISDDLHDEMTQVSIMKRPRGRYSTAQEFGAFEVGHTSLQHRPKRGPRRYWRRVLGEMERSRDPDVKAVADRLRGELALHDRYESAYYLAMRTAPPEVQQAESERQSRRLLDAVNWTKRGKHKMTKAEREEVEAIATEAMRMYSPNQLDMLWRDGERLKHQRPDRRGRSRAFATPTDGENGGGSAHMDMARFRAHSMQTRYQAPATLNHELAHRFDAIMSADGDTGTPWEDRPGLPHGAVMWNNTYRQPFDAQRAGGVLPLPYEPSGRSKWYHAGGWVDPYEARIYSGRVTPGRQYIEDDNGSRTGPIEYIAMAATYHTRATMAMTREIASRKPGTPVSSALFRLVDHDRDGQWFRAVRMYGTGYRDGFEDLHGQPGLRAMQRLFDGPNAPKFVSDGDVWATAHVLGELFGLEPDELLEPDGLLGKHMVGNYWPGRIPRRFRFKDDDTHEKRLAKAQMMVGTLHNSGDKHADPGT